MLIAIVTGALGTVMIGLLMELEELETVERIETI